MVDSNYTHTHKYIYEYIKAYIIYCVRERRPSKAIELNPKKYNLENN